MPCRCPPYGNAGAYLGAVGGDALTFDQTLHSLTFLNKYMIFLRVYHLCTLYLQCFPRLDNAYTWAYASNNKYLRTLRPGRMAPLQSVSRMAGHKSNCAVNLGLSTETGMYLRQRLSGSSQSMLFTHRYLVGCYNAILFTRGVSCICTWWPRQPNDIRGH
jgi:hypothetical protein